MLKFPLLEKEKEVQVNYYSSIKPHGSFEVRNWVSALYINRKSSSPVRIQGFLAICTVKMGSKGRSLPRGSFRKSSSSTLIFSIMIICSFFVLILLALGILSIPNGSDSSPKAHDLSSIVHRTTTIDRSVSGFTLYFCSNLSV